MNIRTLIKKSIQVLDFVTKAIPAPKFDVLFIVDFPGDDKLIAQQFTGYKVKTIYYTNKKIVSTAFWARRSKLIYVDNMNIVVSSLNNLPATVIQYWHATSAVKKFGLITVDDTKNRAQRIREYQNYDLFAVNSKHMENCFRDAFNISEEQMYKVGAVQSNQLFTGSPVKLDGDYIVYVPTFRHNAIYNEGAIEFIKNFSSNDYQLIYSLHPKVKATINNPNATCISGDQIRSYFKQASLIISDYSSLLIDASLINDKVVMYGYDINEYRKQPGLYIDDSNFWGYFTYSQHELEQYIKGGNYKRHHIDEIKDVYFTYDGDKSEGAIAKIGLDLLFLN